jgi:hypothetical protein
MTKKQQHRIVFEVIAQNSRWLVADIQASYDYPNKDLTLDYYFTQGLKGEVAADLKERMKCIDSTELTNNLFTTIRRMSQLLKAVNTYCPTNEFEV